ncbi:MAG TPA: Gfo/Idh/MocA family oxidoreductase [Spirochaetota bacterium]|nr:Gfo/Idh/MocA family oxidoreductase [Spirochaetota bacterium]
MKYTIAVIGCGRISLKHIEGIINNREKLILVATSDKCVDKAREKALEYQNKIENSKVNVYADYKELLIKEKPDIVTVASESGYHCEIAIESLNHGANVIVEKPMALSTIDADNMIKVAQKNNRKLAVSFQNRFNKPVQQAYNALKQNRFGKILHGMVQVRWNRNNDYYKQADWRGTWQLDGGTLMNQCTHGIDLLQWFMGGKVKRVYGVLRRFLRPIEAEDFGSGIIEFDNGSVGIIEGSADIYPKNLSETLSIFGEDGSVVIGGVAVNKLETWRFKDSNVIGDYEEKMINNNEPNIESVYGYGHTALFLDFVKSIEDNREPLINGEEGKKSLELILALYKSMKDGSPIATPIEFGTNEMKDLKM